MQFGPKMSVIRNPVFVGILHVVQGETDTIELIGLTLDIEEAERMLDKIEQIALNELKYKIALKIQLTRRYASSSSNDYLEAFFLERIYIYDVKKAKNGSYRQTFARKDDLKKRRNNNL